MIEILFKLKDFKWPYIKFPDNRHSLMTNPKLFRDFCLPAYQRYTTILHEQGEKVGSHIDGDVKPLLALLNETGLDVCESFSPDPLKKCTFQVAWKAWENGPLIWGGIPSPFLEDSTTFEAFNSLIRNLFDNVEGRPIIRGIVDLFMRHNLIERVKFIVGEVENHHIREMSNQFRKDGS